MAKTSEPSWQDHARDALSRGRSGAAREAVITHLADQHCCLSAQELFDQLRSDGRTVGLASVYRALEQLADARLVHRIDLGDGVARFEPAHPGGEHHHHHLVCGECGKVEMFDDPGLERALKRVASAQGFELDHHDVVLRGACGDCRG